MIPGSGTSTRVPPSRRWGPPYEVREARGHGAEEQVPAPSFSPRCSSQQTRQSKKKRSALLWPHLLPTRALEARSGAAKPQTPMKGITNTTQRAAPCCCCPPGFTERVTHGDWGGGEAHGHISPFPSSSCLQKPPGTRTREEATALRWGWRSPEFTKHRDTKPRVQRVSKHPGKPGPRPQGSTGSCSAPPSPSEPSTSQHGHQLAPIWGHGREQPREGGRLQPRMLRRSTNPTSTCSATAEAADVMKKTIHEEIITLQNYFKSMRAKTDVWGGGWGQAAVTPGPLPPLRPPRHPQGRGTPTPPARGAAWTHRKMLQNSKTWPQNHRKMLQNSRTWPQNGITWLTVPLLS